MRSMRKMFKMKKLAIIAIVFMMTFAAVGMLFFVDSAEAECRHCPCPTCPCVPCDDPPEIGGKLPGLPGLNDPPVANDDEAEVKQNSENNKIDVLVNDADPDGDPISIVGIVAKGGPIQGSVAIIGGDYLSYTPAVDFLGTELIIYVIFDGIDGYDDAALTVTVAEEDLEPDYDSIWLYYPETTYPDEFASIDLADYVVESVDCTIMTERGSCTVTYVEDFEFKETLTWVKDARIIWLNEETGRKDLLVDCSDWFDIDNSNVLTVNYPLEIDTQWDKPEGYRAPYGICGLPDNTVLVIKTYFYGFSGPISPHGTDADYTATGIFVIYAPEETEEETVYEPNQPEPEASGAGACYSGIEYGFIADLQIEGDFDPESPVYYTFNWGDGFVEELTDQPITLGEIETQTVSALHTWQKAGIYDVRVKALVDDSVAGLVETEWSKPLPVIVQYGSETPHD